MRFKRVLVLSLLAGIPLVAGGDLEARGLKVLGGPAWGKFASGWDMTNGWKPGYLIGVGFESGSGLLGCEADLCYMLKSNSYNSRGWDYEIGEISVPILARIKPFPGATPFLLAGGELAYVLSHKQSPGPRGEKSYDMLDNTRRFDYGLVLGLGFGLDLGGLTVELAGRYHHGLAKVFGLGWQEFDLQTRALALVLGLVF